MGQSLPLISLLENSNPKAITVPRKLVVIDLKLESHDDEVAIGQQKMCTRNKSKEVVTHSGMMVECNPIFGSTLPSTTSDLAGQDHDTSATASI